MQSRSCDWNRAAHARKEKVTGFRVEYQVPDPDELGSGPIGSRSFRVMRMGGQSCFAVFISWFTYPVFIQFILLAVLLVIYYIIIS